MKTQREFGEAENILRMANSAQMVLPLPVGAPTNTSSSVLYRALNTTRERQVRMDGKSERGEREGNEGGERGQRGGREREMRGEREGNEGGERGQ